MKSRRPLFIVTVLFWCLGVCNMNAQTNPKPGYIITNSNDTVTGVIDYKNDYRNTLECRFQKGGTGEYIVYKPSEIKGFRLSDNGAYYLTKTVEINHKQEQLFAEYLLKGGVNLYFICLTDGNYYYFEGENGRTGMVKERDYLDYYETNGMEIKRQDMDALSPIFYKSAETVEKLWKTGYDKKTLTKLVRNYSELYCEDAGDCVEYRYDEKKAVAIIPHFYVGAGFKIGNTKPKFINRYKRNHELILSAFIPNITLGCDFEFPRFSKHVMAQAHANIGYLSAKKDDKKLTGVTLKTQYGMVYKFNPENKWSPIVRGGVSIDHLLWPSGENMDYFSGNNKEFFDIDLGVYAGIGSNIAVGKHIMQVTANYEFCSSIGLLKGIDEESLRTSVFVLGIGFIF